MIKCNKLSKCNSKGVKRTGHRTAICVLSLETTYKLEDPLKYFEGLAFPEGFSTYQESWHVSAQLNKCKYEALLMKPDEGTGSILRVQINGWYEHDENMQLIL